MSEIPAISLFVVEANAFGGDEDSLQFTSKLGPMEQPELTPIPKGYGTVRSPHLVAQLGFAVVAASEKDLRLAEAVEGLGGE